MHNWGSVGVVMDTVKGELSFALNGVNLGVAYKGIPLNKPLVPCVLLGNDNDSVEIEDGSAGLGRSSVRFLPTVNPSIEDNCLVQ